ncbi:hypothetical protein D3C75_948910 [compost metagenome]
MASSASCGVARRAIIQAARYCEARQPPAVATLPCATKGASTTLTPASTTQGLVVRSVQAGRSPIRPSLASSRVPEHWAPINWRDGSSFSCDRKAGSAA